MIERIPRVSYFLSLYIFSFPLLLVVFVISYLERQGHSDDWILIPCIIWFVIALIGQIYFSVRSVIGRLHDIGKRGIQGLWLLVPVISLYWGFLLLFKKGDGHENSYGPPPIYDDQNYAYKFANFFLVLVMTFTLIVDSRSLQSEESSQDKLARLIKQEPRDLSVEIFDTKNPTPMVSESLEENARNCNHAVTYNIAKSLLKAGIYDVIELAYNIFEKNCDEFLELRWLAYHAAKSQKDFAQAKRLVSAMIDDYPHDKDYYSWRGLLYERYGFPKKAIQDFEQVIKLSPQIRRIPLNLASLYNREEQYCNADRILVKYFKEYPEVNRGRWLRMHTSISRKCKRRESH